MDTIFAPLTIKGKCSIFVIRISGTKTKLCLEKLGVFRELTPRKATVCTLKDTDGSNLDEAMLIYFQAPNSFTGEDVCELNLHCSTYIINRVYAILNSIDGVRLAEHGEYSRRAFYNNRLDLTQAEAIVDLVNSETELQHKQAIEQLKGKNSKFFINLREKIVGLLSNIEAYIDFPEDDIDEENIKNLHNKTNEIINEINFDLNDNKVGQLIKDGLHISIIGEPNAGKSSLLNYFAKRDIAIVSNIAGTTRDIIEVSLDIKGLPVIMSDTAGIRKTTNEIEEEGIKRAINNAKNADLKMLIIDINDININNSLLDLIDNKTIIVLNKIDLLHNNENYKKIKSKFKNVYDIVEISIQNGKNVDKLIDILENFISKNITPYTNTNITQERYRKELTKCIEYLSAIDFSQPIEIIAENIRLASFCIGKITGQINTEEILDNIFSKFCIGK